MGTRYLCEEGLTRRSRSCLGGLWGVPWRSSPFGYHPHSPRYSLLFYFIKFTPSLPSNRNTLLALILATFSFKMYSSPAHRSPLVKHPLSRTDSSNRDLVYDYPPVPPAPAVYSSGEKPLINFESDGESECDESLLQEVKSLKHSRVLQQSPIPPPPAPQRNMDLILSPQV